jgi:RimJ/RimL family protein N-acetyltransferase
MTASDLPVLYQFIYGDAEPEWKRWDAPYFPLVHISYEGFVDQMQTYLTAEAPSRLVIETDGQVIGTVSYYWEHKESSWLEAGIVIYDPAYWSHGYGSAALTLWIDHLFATMPLVRVGLTTWSGNQRMVRSAEKLGFQMEGRLRKCRLWQGEYYDSIRMGVLREEWSARCSDRARGANADR